ncbi:tetratricopeptide repeat protein [Anabaena sp. CCY 9910]|uniref:tetratricopeptide repeat protein n=1 Tax=Anabaena sp. CCY 9910 TaxID=3103870 RepID=UPI0039DFCD67
MLFANSLENQLQQWNEVISKQPNNPNAYVRRGMVQFQLAKIEESIDDFDTAEKLDDRIKPYLWQRGLSYYYADRFAEGAQQFEIDLTVNSQDVEETVWRYLCMARLVGVTEARNNLLTVKNDPRLIMRSVYDLFAGYCTPDDVFNIGKTEGNKGKFYSHLYLGLYYEAENNLPLAQEYIVKAADKYKLDDYMWYLAQVHKKLRGWI